MFDAKNVHELRNDIVYEVATLVAHYHLRTSIPRDYILKQESGNGFGICLLYRLGSAYLVKYSVATIK